MKMKSEKKKEEKKKEKEEEKEKEKEEEKEKEKKKNDVLVEQIAASKQLQMQVLALVKKTSFRSVAKK